MSTDACFFPFCTLVVCVWQFLCLILLFVLYLHVRWRNWWRRWRISGKSWKIKIESSHGSLINSINNLWAITIPDTFKLALILTILYWLKMHNTWVANQSLQCLLEDAKVILTLSAWVRWNQDEMFSEQTHISYCSLTSPFQAIKTANDASTRAL